MRKQVDTMSYALRTRYSPDVLLSMSGAIFMILGFFLPLMVVRPLLGTQGSFTFSQWDMVVGFWGLSQYGNSLGAALIIAVGLFILAAYALPFLTTLVGLLAFCLTIIRKRPVSPSARWMLYTTSAGAVLEWLVASATFSYNHMSPYTLIQITPGFILLVVGSLLLLLGILIGEVRRNMFPSEMQLEIVRRSRSIS
jgi:hypothetical protein